jgi:hypothetical protein
MRRAILSCEIDGAFTEIPTNAEPHIKITLGGITIDFNPLQEKTDSSIRSSLEEPSKITVSSDVHNEKLDLPKVTTDVGMRIELN